MQLKEYSITIDGKRAYYWRTDANHSETILFLHGFPGNHLGLLDLAECLAQDYNILMVDLPACGKSEMMPGSHDLASYSRWLETFLERIAMPTVIVVGHSFGARLAIHFSARYGSKISASILLTPVVKIDGIWPKLGALNYSIARFLPDPWHKKYLANKFYQHFLFWLTFKSDDKEKRDKIRDQSTHEMSHLNAKVHQEMFNDLRQQDLVSLAENSVTPCLIIVGRKDEVAPVKAARVLTEKIRNVTFMVMEKTGHLLPIEHPEKTAQIITRWLTGLSS